MNPLSSARIELESLLKRQAEIERKIEAVTKSIRLLEPVYAQEPEFDRLGGLSTMLAEWENVGITEAVLRVLMTSREGLRPTQVRDLLVTNGYQVRGDNPMSTVHTVLKRLASRPDGSIVVEDNSGKLLYKYVAQAAADSTKGRPLQPCEKKHPMKQVT